MEQLSLNSSNHEVAGSGLGARLTELNQQHWNRDKSHALAKQAGVDFNDELWAVISFLRSYYFWNGWPENPSIIAKALNRHFSTQGGDKYLRKLFSEDPVMQGSHLANIRIPVNDTSSLTVIHRNEKN